MIQSNNILILNQISFKVDKTFTREYGYDKAYMLCLDLTADATGTGEPPIQMFTLKGGDFINNKFIGVKYHTCTL